MHSSYLTFTALIFHSYFYSTFFSASNENDLFTKDLQPFSIYIVSMLVREKL